ncbi:hypothetical protein D3C81_2007480 [compost metagenome]
MITPIGRLNLSLRYRSDAATAQFCSACRAVFAVSGACMTVVGSTKSPRGHAIVMPGPAETHTRSTFGDCRWHFVAVAVEGLDQLFLIQRTFPT